MKISKIFSHLLLSILSCLVSLSLTAAEVAYGDYVPILHPDPTDRYRLSFNDGRQDEFVLLLKNAESTLTYQVDGSAEVVTADCSDLSAIEESAPRQTVTRSTFWGFLAGLVVVVSGGVAAPVVLAVGAGAGARYYWSPKESPDNFCISG